MKTSYSTPPHCIVDGCSSTSGLVRQMCNLHYKRWYKHGDPNYFVRGHDGLGNIPERAIYHRMKARCNNPNSHDWMSYGGRGIEVCQRWQDSFLAFIDDMGRRPSTAYSIDRIDVDGDYEPSNCRWATYKTQGNNRRNNRLVTIDSVTKTMQLWIDESGVKTTTVYQRLRYGWSMKEALGMERRNVGTI